MRKIIHVDMDAFYAAVEQRDRPELRGKPLVIGGDPRGRGVVATCSYEARVFGIHSAMSCAEAYRRCPTALFVPPDMKRYVAESKKIRAIFHAVTPLVEPLSLDEAYLDVTENLLEMPLARDVARHIKDRIRDELHLTASAGVGPNKLVAKIASDLDKPDGLVVIAPQRVEAFVAGLAVEKLWSVGPATARRLHAMGIRTAAELKAFDEKALRSAFGKHGGFLWRIAHGRDDRAVTPYREPKSKGAERTFPHDVRDPHVLLEVLEQQAARVTRMLARIDRRARTITLKLRYGDFTTITRSRTLATPTADTPVIFEAAGDLLLNATAAGTRPVRLIGVSVSGLGHDEGPRQLPLPGF